MALKTKTTDPLLNKTIPHNIDAETALLSTIFVNNDILNDIIDIISWEDFYKGAHKKIFRTIVELFQDEEPADIITVSNHLKKKNELEQVGGNVYLVSISDSAPLAMNAVQYAKIIRGKAALRHLITTSSDIIEKCLKDTSDFSDIIDQAETAILKVSEKRSKGSFQLLKNLLGSNLDRLEARQEKSDKLLGLPTGLEKLDNIISGLQKSDLIILAARPSMGKTALALNIASNIAKKEKKPVAIFSLEMSNDQLSMRLLTGEARINSQRLRTGYISLDDWEMVNTSADILSELPIFIDDTPNISAMEIRAKTRKLYQKHNDLGLIIIDYLQLMKPSIRNERRDLEIAEISRSLKALAKELDIPVLALSQLNRMLEQRSEKRPMLADLRESGALEQDADIVAFIYRDKIYNPEKYKGKKDVSEIIVAKNRNGATGTAYVHFIEEYTKFEKLSSQEYTELE